MAFIPIGPGGAQAGAMAAQLAQQRPRTPYTNPAEAERLKHLAEILGEGGERPVDSGLGALSNIAQIVAGKFHERRAGKLEAQNAQNRQETIAEILMEPDPEKRRMKFAQAQDPAIQELGLQRSFQLGDEKRKYAREDDVMNRRRGFDVEDREDVQQFQSAQSLAARGFQSNEADKDRSFRSRENTLDRQSAASIAQAKAQAAAASKQPKGVEAVDREYAKEYVKWRGPGQANAVGNIEKIAGVRQQLLSGEQNLTGPAIGLVPDRLRPEATQARETVESVIQQSLREILGGQFAQKEGEQLIRRSYNENLPEAENAKRLGRLLAQLQAAAAAREDQAKYFEENGTLQGWQGRIPTLQEITDMVTASDNQQSAVDDLLKKYGVE